MARRMATSLYHLGWDSHWVRKKPGRTWSHTEPQIGQGNDQEAGFPKSSGVGW